MMYAKCKMALNNDLIDKVLFVQNEQKMSEIRLTSQFHMMFDWLALKQKKHLQNTCNDFLAFKFPLTVPFQMVNTVIHRFVWSNMI